MSETATLEQTQAATPATSADVTPPASDDVQPPASIQEPPADAEEHGEPSQETKGKEPAELSLEEIAAAIKVSGNKYRAIADGAISDADAERHDKAEESARQSNQDRVNTLAQQRQQAADNGVKAQANYTAVINRILNEALPDDLAQALQNEAAQSLVAAAGDFRMTEARLRFIDTLSALKGGDELANKASLTRTSLEDLVGQLVPDIIEKVQAEQLQELRDGKLPGYRLLSNKDYDELEKAKFNEAKAEVGGVKGTVSGEPATTSVRFKTQEEARALHALPDGTPNKISNAEMRRLQASPEWKLLPAR